MSRLNGFGVSLLLVTLALSLATQSRAGSASGGGGGDLQIVDFLIGPQPVAAASKPAASPVAAPAPDSFEGRAIKRLFLGSATWGLEILDAMIRVGYSFDLAKSPAPLSREQFAQARALIAKLSDPNTHSLTFKDSLKDKLGVPVWAINNPVADKVELSWEAWAYSGKNLRDTCVRSFQFPVDLNDPRSLKSPQPVLNIAHCYKVLAAAIATHEVLSLLDLEGDRHYQYSSALLVFLGSRAELVNSKWAPLLAERDKLTAFTKKAGEAYLKTFREQLAIEANRQPFDATYYTRPVSYPWLTLAMAYRMEPVEPLMNKALFRPDAVSSPKPPTGTYAYVIAPFSSDVIQKVRSHAMDGWTWDKAPAEALLKQVELSGYFAADQNYPYMSAALNVIDETRRLTLRSHAGTHETKYETAVRDLNPFSPEKISGFFNGEARVIHLPELPTIAGMPKDHDLLSINDYHRTPGYWKVEEASHAAFAIKDPTVESLLEEQQRLEKLLGEIAYDHDNGGYKLLIIDHLGSLSKGDLAVESRKYTYYGWRHVHAASLLIYQISQRERRPFLETFALQRLLALVQHLAQATKRLASAPLDAAQKQQVAAVNEWLEKTNVELEIVGGLDRGIAYQPQNDSHSFRVTVQPNQVSWFPLGRGNFWSLLEKYAGKTIREYGAQLHISAKQTGGGFLITAHPDAEQSCVDLPKFLLSLDINKRNEGTGLNQVKIHPLVTGLIKYLHANPRSYVPGVCTDGVALKFSEALEGHYETVFKKRGVPRKIELFAPVNGASSLLPELEKNIIRVNFPLGEIAP